MNTTNIDLGYAESTTERKEGDLLITTSSYKNGTIEETVSKNGIKVKKIIKDKNNKEAIMEFDEKGRVFKYISPNGDWGQYFYNENGELEKYETSTGIVNHEDLKHYF